ncbi:YbhB/YbcL family Raf kinase inhibitor-like protein [Cellulomonas sp. PhB150]|uniref:YbhB/YbcL family Raf kinase inhibitor-like protein n=1 Tax=Cellulomonas sp. PhB150 TaxID=2485188 RepID=UPI000F4A93FA|nr:YbhB/YbcL family Raf kinase inhibitor-like protein [Cellulomonas sp. PhB150]ROS23195.1 hypothetical protein EDF34_3372 [Cellulomonas sp. PhB150]
MNRLLLALPAAVAALALAGCSADAAEAGPTSTPTPTAALRLWPGWTPSAPGGDLTLASSDFEAGGELPRSIELDAYGCTGDNIRPELHWDGLPAGTKSVVVTFTAEGGGPLNRWTLVDVPADVTSLPAGAENPDVGIATQNALRGDTVIGPCALEGESWELWFTVYALDTTLDVEPKAPQTEVLAAGLGHVLEAAELAGTFSYEAPAGS